MSISNGNTAKFAANRLAQVLIAPIVSEKATMTAEKHNQILFTVCTDSTSTLNSSSTAALISGLVASRITLKRIWLCFSAVIVAFSLTMGAIST